MADDEPEPLQLLADLLRLSSDTTWAVDLADGAAALLIGLLLNHDEHLLYILGRTVNRAASGYRGEGKIDARDAAVIADQARMRRDNGARRTAFVAVTRRRRRAATPVVITTFPTSKPATTPPSSLRPRRPADSRRAG
ncbi:transposase [Streptomyces sp. NPDC053750]|uniref:IS110 family transposase n=1 Tax=Streptomyces sp. NPDC053750 TaxID=3365714 RepID=UPI0037CCD23D